MKKELLYKRLNIDLDPETHKKFKMVAILSSKSMREIVYECIKDHIKKLKVNPTNDN